MNASFKKSLFVASILSAITFSAQAVNLPYNSTVLADPSSGNKPAAAYKVDENIQALNGAIESNKQETNKRFENMSGLVQDVNNKATVAEMKADSNTNKINQNKQDIADNTNKINQNKQAIAANTETIKQHYAEMKNNYAEMKNNFAAVNSRIDNLDEEMKKGFASQAALNGLFQPYNVGKFNLSVAIGGYESEQAMALGTGYRFNENFAMKAGIASDLGGFDSVTYNIGANFEW